MTTRRRQNELPDLADLEGAASPTEAPGVMPPPGTEAQIKTEIRYNRVITDANDYYSEDLRNLATENDDNLPLPVPQDAYTEFIHTWQKFQGYPLKIARLPDPANRRMPGHTYNSPCFEFTMLSDMPFDPNNLIGMLQVINNNSGGVFRVFLTDEIGTPIPSARLDRLVVADPPRQYGNNNQRTRTLLDDPEWQEREHYYRQRQLQPAPAPPIKSETELYIEQMQRELFQKVMMRALDPPTPPAPDPLSALSPDDRLALGLLQRGDILETAVTRIANLAQAPDRIESATWKDKLADASIQLVTHNPQVVATATDILSRLVMALASAFAPRGTQQTEIINQPIPVQHPPAQRVPQPQMPRSPQSQNPQAITGLPETPQPDDEHLDDNEDAEIDMVEDIVKLLLSEKPLSLADPLIQDLQTAYPEIFAQVMLGISQMPSASIIQYVCIKSEFCADLFNSQRNGPYLRQRLEEFKRLLVQPAPIPDDTQNQTENPTQAADTEQT